ncbi:hypothetical protein CFD26_104491 [Aspergillus turcosus]|uniref:Probable beta-glucosidase btgE n=1 Tax=Aspergillus turcosus TaxID=1245748 RepID=A0A421DF18_9EURO|nr:hypothetical protein CFD26_104491 [Aspergillus turcosus]
MRGAILATAAAIAGTAMADVAHMRRHGHDSFHKHRALEADASCGCTTEVVTVWGSPTLVPISTPTPSTVTSESVTTLHSTSTSTVTVVATPSVPATPSVSATSSVPATPKVPLPTPAITTFPSTGVYTIPATTLTVTDSTTVCGATTTQLPSGTHTIGGVTTVVEYSTTVVCPYATVEPSGSTVTSVIKTTTYVCPSAGTYTIAPTTTYVPTETVVVYPTPATITPGTYTQPEQIVTVTRTDYTYVCPFSGQNLPTSAPAAPSTTVAPSTTAAPATTAVPSTSSAPSSAPAPTGVSAVAGQMGMTYTPYTNQGDCKDKSSVLSEVADLASKGFTHVRVYGTDCNSLQYIGEAAQNSGLHMIIGVFITDTGVSGAQDQVTEISKWAQWDLVTLIVVGNEAIQNGYTDAASLAGFISSAKSSFQQAGYTGPVTTTEPINIWQAYGSTLCGACDITGANIHPFFNPDVTADQAGKFVAQEIKVLEGICPGKDVINLETGWPHAGKANGKAVPGVAEQATAIKAIAQEAGSKSVFFSYYDDLWKQPGEFDVEQYWGCIDKFD